MYLKLARPGTPMNEYYYANMHDNEDSYVRDSEHAREVMLSRKECITVRKELPSCGDRGILDMYISFTLYGVNYIRTSCKVRLYGTKWLCGTRAYFIARGSEGGGGKTQGL
jgi:hypothetical protein